jgi:hypothetical protein
MANHSEGYFKRNDALVRVDSIDGQLGLTRRLARHFKLAAHEEFDGQRELPQPPLDGIAQIDRDRG